MYAVANGCLDYDACDACSIVMAEIFQNYINEINQDYSRLFQHFEELIFDTLESENKRVQYNVNTYKWEIWEREKQ